MTPNSISTAVPVVCLSRVLVVILAAALVLTATGEMNICVGQETTPAATAAQDDADVAAENAELKARVQELVDQLGGPSLSGREQAQLELMKLGPSALPFLPSNSSELSSEARRRLEQVQVELERVRALAAAEPTMVSFDNATTVGKAIEQIEAQTGNALSGRFDADEEVDLPEGELTFWEAVDALLDAAGLDVDPYSGELGALGLTSRQSDRPERSAAGEYSGVFRIEPATITTRRNLTDPRLSETRLLIDIAWEPRIAPIRLSLPLENLRVVLSDGSQLPVQESGGEPETTPQPDLPNVELSLPLTVPSRDAESIATVTGKLSATLPGRRRKYEFELDGKIPSSPNRAGNVAVKLERLTPNGPLHEARLSISFEDAGLALESHRTWIFENPVYALDENGFRLDPLGLELYRQTSEEVGIGYLFDLSGDPSGHRLVYETPAAIINTEVPFTLEQIPLP